MLDAGYSTLDPPPPPECELRSSDSFPSISQIQRQEPEGVECYRTKVILRIAPFNCADFQGASC
jgi:hypothetical protein